MDNYLLELFREYSPDETIRQLLDGCLIANASIDADARRIAAVIRPSHYISPKTLERICRQMAAVYELKRFELQPKYAESLFQDASEELCDAIVDQYPPARAILSGSAWTLEGSTIHVQLKANGKDEVSGYTRAAIDKAQALFDVRYDIQVHANASINEDDLAKQQEQLRQDAIQKAVAQTPAPKAKTSSSSSSKSSSGATPTGDVIYGKPGKDEPMDIGELSLDMTKATVEGKVFAINHREFNSGACVVSFDIMDDSGAVKVTQYMRGDESQAIRDGVQMGMYVRVNGDVTMSKFDNELVISPKGIEKCSHETRKDLAGEKRVELHLHTQMSAKDALTGVGDAIKRAAQWGHKAIAITDHGVVHTFPDAVKAAKKNGIKVLLGCEGYYVDDVRDRYVKQKSAILGSGDFSLDDEFIAFDLETTGLDPKRDEITEIGAVKYKNGQLTEEFKSFVAINRKLDAKIIELTGITDEMLEGAPSLEEAISAFIDFCGGSPLAAHNATFDVSFINAACKKLGKSFEITALDTLVLSQKLLPDLVKHKLDVVADTLALPSFNHHRAVDDARTVAYMLEPFFTMLHDKGVERLSQIDSALADVITADKMQKQKAKHIILIAKNQTGLRNLYKLVTLSNIKYFYRNPRIPRSVLSRNREGLIVGSACESGELFSAMVEGASDEKLLDIASYYDFLEIQPICNNNFLIVDGKARDKEHLRDFNRKIVSIARQLNKPVVATGDVHFLDPEDEIYRRVLLAANGFKDADKSLPIYFKTTDEMLEEFSYLGEDVAREVVVTTPNMIADMCDNFDPLPKDLFAPKIENSVEDLKSLVYGKMHRLYGEEPPEIITSRIETELHDIIGRNYDVIYMSAQKLVAKSNSDGYLVGSRGSVGSSLVAYMSGITEVNSLPPHYRCPICKHTDFDVPEGYNCGADLPDEVCPVCGATYAKEGFDIPFETFLGFGGEKVPDIDLNFSGEYQPKAHAYTEELFGCTHVFRAGTIGTVAEKTAYVYAQKYAEERGMSVSKTETTRLSLGCVGVKRTTGQHPGGMVVLPRNKEIYDFCPAQHPADSANTDIVTTHFEYHSMESNLLKLDILGHDDPTMIRRLEDLTGVDATQIPLDDKDTMSIFISSKVLGFENDKLLGPTGAVAIPEFGTSFVRGMLQDTLPDRFDTLVKISGFSHGTDVWLGNAKDLITSGTARVDQVISCRDDIMLYLISMGMNEKKAFKIMECVRKGKGLTEEQETLMRDTKVPEWYIESCKKIQYLFPKAHAVAYVIMAFRIAWFKVHRPLDFYAAYFSIRAKAFDAKDMTAGIDHVKDLIKKINSDPNATANDKDKVVTLEVCYEFYLRGFVFESMDIYKSDAIRFLKTDRGLIPPFITVAGLGENAALNLVEGRKDKKFISIEEVGLACPKVSKTHLQQLKEAGAFGDMPDTSQITFF